MIGRDKFQKDPWNFVFHGARSILGEFGEENAFGEGDFWVLDDDWENRENMIYISNIKLLRPEIIRRLQELLKNARDWSIVVAVDMKAKGLSWPPMGITIHRDEIIDELKREYFPLELRSLRYPGARPRDPSRDPAR